MLFVIFAIIFFTLFMLGMTVVPRFYGQLFVQNERRQQLMSNKFEQVLPRSEAMKVSRFFMFFPVIMALAMYLLATPSLKFIGLIFGVFLGLLYPALYYKYLMSQLRNKFDDQLVDGLMIMSSSFRGGLSLVQAMESVVEEMPDPINREFGAVLGENKMGVSLDEALNHLYNRLPSIALQQMITAILLARETGGNLPLIFSRIVGNIRAAKKAKKRLNSMTLQGKIQGIILSLLPVIFGLFVFSTQPDLFERMIATQMGRTMLLYALVSEIIGATLIWHMSQFKDL